MLANEFIMTTSFDVRVFSNTLVCSNSFFCSSAKKLTEKPIV